MTNDSDTESFKPSDDDVDDFEEDQGEEFVPDAEEQEEDSEEDFVPDDDDDDFEPPSPKKSNRKKRKSPSKVKKRKSVSKTTPGNENVAPNASAVKGLPDGWCAEEKTRKNGKKYFVYVAPDGSKHRSLTAAKRHASASSGIKSGGGPKTKKMKTTKSASKSAKGKKKAKKLSLQEIRTKIVAYLTRENRPLNAVAVYENTKRIMPKTKLQGVLEELGTTPGSGVKMVKFGKTGVFFADQDQFEDASPERLAELKKDLNAAKSSLSEATRALASLRAQEKRLGAEPTDSELKTELPRLREIVAALSAELDAFESKGEKVDPKKKEKLEKALNSYVKVWKKRKRDAMDVVDQFADGAEKKPKQIIALLGLETDEELNVNIKDFQ